MTEQTATTISSSSNLVEIGPAKAVASGVVGTSVAFLSALGVAIDGGVTGSEWVAIALATVLGGAAAFGITYSTPTSVTLK